MASREKVAPRKQAAPREQEYDRKCVYVEGLNPETKEVDLKRVFGTTFNLWLIKVRRLTDRTKAIVEYRREEDANTAVSRLNGSTIDDHKITVEYKKKRALDGAAAQNDKPGLQQPELVEPFTDSLRLDHERLRFFSTGGRPNELAKKFSVSIEVTYRNTSVRVSGHKEFVLIALAEIKKISDGFVVKTCQPSEEFYKCFDTIRDRNIIIASLRKHRTQAGWDLRDGLLYVCSNCLQNVDRAFEAIRDLISEVEYPADRELSAVEIRAIVAGSYGASWLKLVSKVKDEDSTKSLQIQHLAKKVKFALRSDGHQFQVKKSLDEFFNPNTKLQ